MSAAAGTPARAAGAPASTGRASSGRCTAPMCLYLFVPILVVIVYSFNSGNSLQVFEGLSFRWYREFWNDPEIKNSLIVSFQIAAVTMVVATILGTLLAFGLVRARGRIGGSANILMLLPLITPEIVTAVGLLLFFGRVEHGALDARRSSSATSRSPSRTSRSSCARASRCSTARSRRPRWISAPPSSGRCGS